MADTGAPYDAIVIGSGVGGMVAASLLSKAGLGVLLLEQHSVAGGFTQTFSRRGYTWDIGVHAVGEVTAKSFGGRLLDLATGGRLQWASLGPVYDSFHFPDGARIDFPDSPTQLRENLCAAFPSEAPAVDAFLKLSRQVARGMRGYYAARALPAAAAMVSDPVTARVLEAYAGQTALEVTSKLTREPRLAAMFNAQWGYHGAPPARASFAMQALLVNHYLWGGHYPVGGGAAIADALTAAVTGAGGAVRLRTGVREVLLEGGRAVGVRLENGAELRARRVVSAIGAQATVSRLLPESARDAAWVREIGALRAGPAHVCLYLGFKGDIRAAGAGANNLWYFDAWDTAIEQWPVRPDESGLPRPRSLYVSFPSLKDPAHQPGPEQRHTGECLAFVPWEAFAPWRETQWKRRGADYEAFKLRLQQALAARLFAHLPGLKPLVDHLELSTPVTTDHFTRAAQGSIYGLEPSPARFACQALRPRTPVPGLFLAGVDVGAIGVMGAALSGAMAALAAEPMAVLGLLRRSAV